MAGELLDSYVSPILIHRLVDGNPIETPETRTLDAAVAAIDVEGFSSLAESLSSRGPAGIEELASLINACFGSLVETIGEHGGIVHTFPGDAVIALWLADDSSLAEATIRAAACGKLLTSDEGRPAGLLPLKAGLGAGAITTAHVGGVHDWIGGTCF